jgi:acyl-CoA synthetase (NDP forming)/GNAT superfamily N-acetyltransferase
MSRRTHHAETPAYALLADGTTVEIRPATTDDLDGVRRFYDGMSEQNRYLRFLGAGRRVTEEAARRICRPRGEDHEALVAVLTGEIIGVAECERTGRSGEAEVACAVADRFHHRGVATLLLEHLVTMARDQGLTRFVAETLAYNHPMLRVFADMGLHVSERLEDGIVQIAIQLEEDDRYLETVAERERLAEVASLRPLFAPRVVAVVGAGRRRDSVGHAVLGNLVGYGFTGALYAVNPHAEEVAGVPCYPSVASLPEKPDVAVLAVPAGAVPDVAEECGRRGVRAMVVVTSGLDAEQGRTLHDTYRRHGMRLVGPNCLGIAATDRDVRLNATFAAGAPEPGTAGLVVQSGGVGIALLEHLRRVGIGVSTFASVGDKYDVSANDMLQWWASDDRTAMAVVYVESFGNPRKFSRTARRIARSMPVLTVKAGRSEAGRRAAASHTAAAATPAASREALFTQAGVIAADSLAELVETATLLAYQPLPAGDRVAILSNAGGAGVLAADACVEAGLTVPVLEGTVVDELTAVLPPGASVGNPVDATAAVTTERLRGAMDVLTACPAVDAVLVLIAPTALGELRSALTGGPGRRRAPVLAVTLDQVAAVEAISCADGGRIPAYADPQGAARALANAQRYAVWRQRPVGRVPALPDVDSAQAGDLVTRFLDAHPTGGWLPPDRCADILACYGVPVQPLRLVRTEAEAVTAARELGTPVALKAYWPELVHKTDVDAVRLGVDGEDQVRAAYRDLGQRFAGQLSGVVVQSMAAPGVEVLAGVTQDDVFGPLVLFGLGGVTTDVLGDHASRLTPLTDLDAAELIDSLRAAALLHEYRGRPALDLPGLRDLLLRLSRLADDLPQVTELDLNPVIARPDGVVAADCRIRIVPRRPRHPYLRQLR